MIFPWNDKRQATKQSSFWSYFIAGLFIFIIAYVCIANFYLLSTKKSGKIRVQHHSIIIAHDLWNLNDTGMSAYLKLVVSTEHYKDLDVLTDTGRKFISLQGAEPGAIDKALRKAGIITIDQILKPIYYQGQQIGTFQGERYNRSVYPLFYIFCILSSLAITVICFFYLIFNRRLLEQQVRERTQKYHELVNLLPEMVLETDTQGLITFANEKAQKRLDISDFSKSRYDCREYIRLENGEKTSHDSFVGADSQTLASQEYFAKGCDNSLFPILVRSAPIFHNDQLVGARMIIVDITERKALEEQLNQDRKMKYIGVMAGGVAHDLNNILSGIINYPELVLHQIPEDSPLVKLVSPIKEAGLRAAAIVSDLLTVARGVAASKEVVDINSILGEYLESPEFKKLHTDTPHVVFHQELSDQELSISCSISHVRKSIMNLVSNAFEAVEGAGEVFVETTRTTVDTPSTTGHGVIEPGVYVVVSVKDTGKGIQPNEIENIFEPFFSKKELGRSGTGLGLTVVWNTMQDHDGGIRVVSSSNGSCFELYFPISLVKPKSHSSAATIEMFRGSGESILIVDDESQQRDIAARLLSSLGYTVKSVSSGDEAVTYLKTSTVDLILLDMIMGKGMNGLQTYKEILKLHPRQKALIQSGYSESDDVKNTIRMGAGGLINKPYTKVQLAKAIYNEFRKN